MAGLGLETVRFLAVREGEDRAALIASGRKVRELMRTGAISPTTKVSNAIKKPLRNPGISGEQPQGENLRQNSKWNKRP